MIDRFLCSTLIGLILLAFAPAAQALINPKFTPIQLTSDADTVLTVKVKNKEIGQKVELEVTGTLKGKAPASLSIDLGQAAKEHVDAARKQLTEYAGEDSLFFVGKDEHEQATGFLHVHGMWLRLNPGANGAFSLDVIDTGMETTWNGGTDMLTRCVRYILADNDATVPVTAGTSWQGVAKIAHFTGPARDIAVVDLAGDGKPTLFIAGDKGDRFFKPGAEAFEDITARLKLQSASLLAAWGDFDGDGRLDLASYDGTNLKIWSQAADGTFSAAKAGGAFTLPPNCVGLAVIGVDAKPGLLVSPASGAPILLKLAGRNTFEAVPLPAAPAGVLKEPGAAGACVVADFTGDGIVDVIQPFEKGGLIYLGNKSGGFDVPKACGVNTGVGGGRATLGDLDADGLSDIVVAGVEGVRIFQNHGNGNFEESLSHCGEAAYKSQPAATCCAVGDFNGDSRQDMVVFYHGPDQGPQVFFNRGFRSFGEAPELELDREPALVPDVKDGQQLVLLADFANAGAQDLIVILNSGDVWRVSNSQAGDTPPSIKARIALKSGIAGPVNVTLWREKRCLGTIVVTAGGAPAFFGVENANTYTLKWIGAGGKEMSKDVVVDKPVEVVLDGK